MKRKIVIGDIHSCYDELQDLLNKIGPSAEDLIIAAGDVFDRGPKPIEVYQFFRENNQTRLVMGNHDRKHAMGSMTAKAQNITKAMLGGVYPEVVSWLQEQKYYYESTDLVVVHAALVPGVSMEKQEDVVLCGTMSGQRKLRFRLDGKPWYELYDDPRPVVFGHKIKTPEKKPFIYNNIIFGIDTGACHGGFLTAVAIPGLKIYSVKARKNYWSSIKHEW